MQTKHTYQTKCRNPCYDPPSPKTLCETTLFSSPKIYDCFNCWSFKSFAKMTHFALVLKKKWTIYIQRFKYLLLHSNCTIPDSALCCEPANLSLKCLHFFHHKRQTGLYPLCFWEWFYKLSAGNKWEFTSFCLHWSIFFSLPSLNKTMQASWMMYCCT